MKFDLSLIYEYAIKFGLNLLAAAIIFIIGKWVARVVAKVVETAMLKSKLNKTLVIFAKNIVYGGILIFVFLAALSKLGVETTSFVALIGGAGLAVGFALQGSLSNFAAGVMLVIFHPFEVGNIIEAGGALGRVEEVQIFNTIIKTADNKRVIVPNSKITADKITIHYNS
jgi:small conductance mechanosensitive channel